MSAAISYKLLESLGKVTNIVTSIVIFLVMLTPAVFAKPQGDGGAMIPAVEAIIDTAQGPATLHIEVANTPDQARALLQNEFSKLNGHENVILETPQTQEEFARDSGLEIKETSANISSGASVVFFDTDGDAGIAAVPDRLEAVIFASVQTAFGFSIYFSCSDLPLSTTALATAVSAITNLYFGLNPGALSKTLNRGRDFVNQKLFGGGRPRPIVETLSKTVTGLLVGSTFVAIFSGIRHYQDFQSEFLTMHNGLTILGLTVYSFLVSQPWDITFSNWQEQEASDRGQKEIYRVMRFKSLLMSVISSLVVFNYTPAYWAAGVVGVSGISLVIKDAAARSKGNTPPSSWLRVKLSMNAIKNSVKSFFKKNCKNLLSTKIQ